MEDTLRQWGIPGLIILAFLAFGRLWSAGKAAREAVDATKRLGKRSEAVRLQYSAVDAIVSWPKKGWMSVWPKITLDNPHNFPLKYKTETLVVTVNHHIRADLSHLNTVETIGPGARNFVMEIGETRFRLRKDQDSFPIRIIWELKYGRGDLEPNEIDIPLRISGVLTIRLFVGRISSQWKEDGYSAVPVREVPAIVIEGSEGDLHRG